MYAPVESQIQYRAADISSPERMSDPEIRYSFKIPNTDLWKSGRITTGRGMAESITRKKISYKTFNDEYNWQEEHYTYTGDSRALDRTSLNFDGNRNFNEPRREEVLTELYRKLYPRVKNSIVYAVDW